jgi:CheY-like chemotaxis protein
MKKVKALPGLKEIPAIAVSGYASDEDRARALEVGYIALIPKPIDVDTLFLLIQNLLRPAVSANN